MSVSTNHLTKPIFDVHGAFYTRSDIEVHDYVELNYIMKEIKPLYFVLVHETKGSVIGFATTRDSETVTFMERSGSRDLLQWHYTAGGRVGLRKADGEPQFYRLYTAILAQ